MQVNASPVRLMRENVLLRTCYSSEAAIKSATRDGGHGNRTTPGKLRDMNSEGQDVDHL